jgi:hypothetical protein
VSFDRNVRKELLGNGNLRDQFEFMLQPTDLLLLSGEELYVATGIEDEPTKSFQADLT